jgi:hypothetical protein
MAYLFFFKALDNLGCKRDLNPKIACSYPEILQNEVVIVISFTQITSQNYRTKLLNLQNNNLTKIIYIILYCTISSIKYMLTCT